MAKSIKVIPSTVPLHASGPALTGEKHRVAAYARVSTDRDEQFTSYEAQIDYYTHYIAGRPDWTFVSVYSDEGIRQRFPNAVRQLLHRYRRVSFADQRQIDPTLDVCAQNADALQLLPV